EVLRLVRELGTSAQVVLGNHDLHLLATARGARARPDRDTFGDVLGAPDREDLVEWLRSRPLVHCDDEQRLALVH
ncbi:MAG: diadenosine tetraphosphatase, partial [Actinobacteria bacterium]|nr:diadenosine tetraphosphatase [Actinomycetota bacterium]